MLKAANVEPSKTTVPFMSSWSRQGGVKDHCAFHVFVEGSDDAEKFGWTSNLGKDLEDAIPTDQIESLCEVYEGNE